MGTPDYKSDFFIKSSKCEFHIAFEWLEKSTFIREMHNNCEDSVIDVYA